ncbi:hypothetical protein SETIT_4G172200v2 [Setaria italica]|uniref:RING-type E3 ubiquitin transferase n=1 Tax=Setaria italica TaxID=4555 RepID=K3XZW4_SETIT|nr:hypothetical protein SETIT_4G172200v2 [Setaria italica]
MSGGFPTSGISLAACMFFISFAILLVTAFLFCCRCRRHRRDSMLPGGRCGGDPPFPVETLPAFCYAPEDSEQGGSSRECAVCLGAVKQGEMVRQLPACMHLYHVVCIDRWLAAHRTCPVCRSQLGSSTGPGAGQSTST